MARTRTAPLILALLVAATAGADRAARGEECLAGPNAQAPQGSHWFYRVDRAAHRKCWYLGDAKRRRASTQTNARRNAPVPEAGDEAPAPPPVPAREAAPDPGFGTRWPGAAPTGTIAAASPAEPARVVASATPVPQPMGARPVPTERVRNEPAPPKPPEPAKPQAAAPPPAVATDTQGALPAALFGIALLLAVVGTILVRARRRMIRVHDEAARGVNDGAARRVGRPRRSLREILAQAEPEDESARSPDGAERNPGLPSNPNSSSRIPLRSMRATASSDIAAATLQPAIDPLVPEAPGSKSPGLEPAPDVEQSLRRLLAAWERRAA
jgi:hypothetical protein